MTKPWTEADDRFLVEFGPMIGDGYEFVAQHDLGRDPGEGDTRIAWLRENQPEFVSEVEAETARLNVAAGAAP